MPTTDREYDLILWGATGFTGQLVAQYLIGRLADSPSVWAIGGRNEDKLSALRQRLGAPELPMVVADAGDRREMAALARRSRVVCSTVGPYARYGSELVAACAANGTDYCDLSGEVQWVRRMIDKHRVEAEANGARMVPSCGVDSIPSDLGTFYLQREMHARFGAPSRRIKCRVAGFKGGASGGTIASMLNAMEEALADRSVRRILANPYALNPRAPERGPDARDLRAPAFDADFGRWTAPFVMASVNSRVVRRSAALLPGLYGPGFHYDESVLTGTGFLGAVKAWGVSASLSAFMAALAIGPLRRLIARRLPKPGEGPTPSEQERGSWDFRFLAFPPEAHGAVPLRARLRGDRDPGYGSTSKMLAESALCLAFDPLKVGGGFHTPAAAMGQSLIDRLQGHAGVSFELSSTPG